MASVRNLKKGINLLTEETVIDCFYYMEFYPEDKQETAFRLINELIGVRNVLIERINNPDGKDNPKLVKEFYSQIRADFKAKMEEFYTELNQLLKED